MLAAAPFRLVLLLNAVVGTLLLATVDGHGDGSDGDASPSAADALARHAHGRRLSSACAARGRRGLSGCPLAPASTAGPFATDTGVVRRNITEGLPGVPFVLDVELVNSSNCTGVEGVAVEIWHCDALGEYSAFAAAGGAFTPTDTTFMRGVQFTNASGVARFETVFPGWYNGRTTHIHVRVHEGLSLGAAAADGSRAYSGGTSVHTGQLYFEDAVADAVALLAPYDTRGTTRKPLLSDGLYTNNGGGIVAVTAADAAAGPGDYAGGVYGTATLGIDFAAARQQLQTGAAAGRPALGLAVMAVAAVAATASGTVGGRGPR